MKRKINFKNVFYAVGMVLTIVIVLLNVTASTNVLDKGASFISLSDLRLSTQTAAACPEGDWFTEPVYHDCYAYCQTVTLTVIGYDEYGNPITMYEISNWTDTGFLTACESAFTFDSCTELPCNANCIKGEHEI